MRTPPPGDLAALLEDVAQTLRRHGRNAIRLAADWSGHGWPTSTLGDGMPRGTTTLTGPERHAHHALNPPPDDADIALARRLATRHTELVQLMSWLWDNGRSLDRLLVDTVAHATTDQATSDRKAGAGTCAACERWVPGMGDDRIRAGYCPRCHRAWLRSDERSRSDPDRRGFERRIRNEQANTNPTRLSPLSPPRD